ncbi:MAG: DNA mismatch endonuclease Vsr [Candidatus Eisenbacteria bacterium]|nr:DNA mismatch endonuclease Vsr [Candidatus Eisenbacteria bacterium]
MTDTLEPEKRSWVMSRVRSKDTSPEITVRSLVHRLGFRFRLHRRDLPGTPDLVFPSRHMVIFVHGCFWHGHRCRRGNRIPKTNRSYWIDKINRNKARDRLQRGRLRRLGWRVMVVWECQLSDLDRLERRIIGFLNSDS